MSSTQEVGEIFGEGSGPAQAMLRSPTVLIVSVGLWGMNVLLFRLFRINYVYVLNFDLMMEKEEANKVEESRLQLAPRLSINSNLNNNNNNNNGFSGNNHVEAEDDSLGDESHTESPSQERYGSAITWEKLVIFSISMLIALHYSTHYWVDHLGKSSIGAIFGFYAIVMIYIFLPISSNRWLRRAFVIILQRAFELVNPRCSCVSPDPAGPRPIPFIDVFFADAMCSLSNVFFDWGMLFHMASHYPDPVPPSTHNILIPSACAAIPYIIRARQCLIMHTVGRIKRYQHIANAVKYSTSIFPLCLSAYQKTVEKEFAQSLDVYLLILLTINATYSLYWDIVMDWGMMQNPSVVVQAACIGASPPIEGQSPTLCHHGFLRPRLRFGLLISSVIFVSDVVLRYSWLLRFVSWFPDNDSFVLCTQFLEVFRRAIWNLLRVEWENIKQKTRVLKARESLSDHDRDDETSPFLGPDIPTGSKSPSNIPGKVATA